MRGPHNLWRLIRTGATFERTGAMRTALQAFDAPPALSAAARVLGWPFQWLGYQGDPTQPPILRALTALGPEWNGPTGTTSGGSDASSAISIRRRRQEKPSPGAQTSPALSVPAA